jgi:hypothetical protein
MIVLEAYPRQLRLILAAVIQLSRVWLIICTDDQCFKQFEHMSTCSEPPTICA